MSVVDSPAPSDEPYWVARAIRDFADQVAEGVFPLHADAVYRRQPDWPAIPALRRDAMAKAVCKLRNDGLIVRVGAGIEARATRNAGNVTYWAPTPDFDVHKLRELADHAIATAGRPAPPTSQLNLPFDDEVEGDRTHE